MNGNGKGPMDRGQGMGKKLGYCNGYKSAGFENEKKYSSLGKRFVQGFRSNLQYTEKELLSLRKFKLQKELELIEERLKNI